jgi:hypothetical protein
MAQPSHTGPTLAQPILRFGTRRRSCLDTRAQQTAHALRSTKLHDPPAMPCNHAPCDRVPAEPIEAVASMEVFQVGLAAGSDRRSNNLICFGWP